jgi:hypothetical protein
LNDNPKHSTEHNLKNTLNAVRTGIYLVMCILFTSLLYAYFSEIFLKSAKSWPLGMLLIVVIVITDYFSRLKISNIFMFFAIHIVLIGMTILLPSELLDKIILTVISVSFLLMAINFWKTESNERSKIVIDIPFAAIIAFIMIYFHSTYFSSTLSTFAYITGILYFLLFFIRDYLDKFFSYSLSSENFSSEMHTIFSTNISLIGLFNLIIIFVIMTTNMFFSDSSFNILGKILKWIAKRFFGFLEGFDNLGGSGEAETPAATFSSSSISETIVTNSSPTGGTNVVTLIFNVLQVFVFAGLAIGVLFIIYSFIKQYMHHNNNPNDEVKKADNDVIEKVKNHTDNDVKKHVFFMSNKEKVRKIFTNKVDSTTKKNNRIILRKSYTSAQIRDSISKEESSQQDSISKLTEIYNKARYSNQEITKEDVMIAKKLQ